MMRHTMRGLNSRLWNPYTCKSEDIFRANVLCLEQAILDPVTQVTGIVAIMDMKGFGFTHIRFCPPSNLQKVVSLIQDCFPARFKAIHVVNEPAIFSMMFGIVRRLPEREAPAKGVTDLAGALGFAGDDGRTEEKRITVTKRGLEGVVVPLGTSPDYLIHTVAGVVGLPVVYSAQHLGAQSFEIVINSRSAAAKLNEAGVVTIASTQVPIVPAGPQVTNVTCMFLPTYVRNDLLVQALSAHGKVLEITHATYRSTPTVKTGTRYVRIKMKESDPVPKFLRIGSHQATFDYPGIKRVCRRCRLEGNIRVNCTTEHCDRCAVFGHATEGCTSDSRRCGGSHATVDCVARQSYSSVVAGTASSDFPPLSPAHESALSGGRPPPAPLPDAAGAMAPETQLVAPAPSLCAVDTYTPWSEV
ncbi:hypothetical protein HPB47_004522 [Ixodes persulcatus]|uniref:Uncharacterized protein n=1 Tax=Ixodes persulcatus TaxID=34615 RepID=A0AC60PG88_IXOPE|nr:hypothetical protein HPB47_004522 [Ixodes persulcatus]